MTNGIQMITNGMKKKVGTIIKNRNAVCGMWEDFSFSKVWRQMYFGV